MQPAGETRARLCRLYRRTTGASIVWATNSCLAQPPNARRHPPRTQRFEYSRLADESRALRGRRRPLLCCAALIPDNCITPQQMTMNPRSRQMLPTHFTDFIPRQISFTPPMFSPRFTYLSRCSKPARFPESPRRTDRICQRTSDSVNQPFVSNQVVNDEYSVRFERVLNLQ
jgi:hypothetical protein